MNLLKHFFLTALISVGCASIVLAAPPTNSRYYTDSQLQYNDDQTSRVFSLVQFVACFLNDLKPEFNAGQPEYVAWVRFGKCDDGGTNSTTDNSTLPFEKAVVKSEYDATTGVLNVKMWLSTFNDNNSIFTPQYFWVNVKITAGPSVAPPLGRWTINFCGQNTPTPGADPDSSSCLDWGYATVEPDVMRVFTKGTKPGDDNSQVGVMNYQVVGGQVIAGAGQFELSQQWNNSNSSYQVAFSGDYMRLKSVNKNNSTSAEICTNRNIGERAPLFGNWDGWLYDVNTGAPVELNGGFNLKLAPGAVTDWSTAGWLSHWGVWFRDVDNSGRPIVINPEQVLYSDSRTSKDVPYVYKKTKGALRRVTNEKDAFSSLLNTRFKTYQLVSFVEGGSSSNSSAYSMYWNGTSFIAEGKYQQSNSGQENLVPLDTVKTLTLENLRQDGRAFLYGHINNSNISLRFRLGEWDSSTNQLRMYNPNATPSSSNPAYVYRTLTDDVLPGVAENGATDLANGIVLTCYGSECPTMSASGISPRPQQILNGGTVANAITYIWNNETGNLMNGQYAVESSSQRQTGALFVGTPTGLDCTYWNPALNNGNGGQESGICPWNAADEGITYYTWETNTSNLNWPSRSYVVKQSNGRRPAFDRPIDVTYTPTRGDLAGKQQFLTYNGGGQFWLPSDCYDLDSRQKISCNGNNNNTFWASQFNIPFTTAAAGKVRDARDPSKEYLVKFGRRSFVYGVESLSACDGLNPPSDLALPTASLWQDPHAANGSGYIGPWKEPTESPRYVNGVQQ
jgi:hypothetical protein